MKSALYNLHEIKLYPCPFNAGGFAGRLTCLSPILWSIILPSCTRDNENCLFAQFRLLLATVYTPAITDKRLLLVQSGNFITLLNEKNNVTIDNLFYIVLHTLCIKNKPISNKFVFHSTCILMSLRYDYALTHQFLK